MDDLIDRIIDEIEYLPLPREREAIRKTIAGWIGEVGTARHGDDEFVRIHRTHIHGEDWRDNPGWDAS